MINSMNFIQPKEEVEFQLHHDIAKKVEGPNFFLLKDAIFEAANEVDPFIVDFLDSAHSCYIMPLDIHPDDTQIRLKITNSRSGKNTSFRVPMNELDKYVYLQGPKPGYYIVAGELYHLIRLSPADCWSYGYNRAYMKLFHVSTGKMIWDEGEPHHMYIPEEIMRQSLLQLPEISVLDSPWPRILSSSLAIDNDGVIQWKGFGIGAINALPGSKGLEIVMEDLGRLIKSKILRSIHDSFRNSALVFHQTKKVNYL